MSGESVRGPRDGRSSVRVNHHSPCLWVRFWVLLGVGAGTPLVSMGTRVRFLSSHDLSLPLSQSLLSLQLEKQTCDDFTNLFFTL